MHLVTYWDSHRHIRQFSIGPMIFLATASKRAGISDFRIHDMRYSCAAWLVLSGVSLIEVRDLLGHSTIKMTERYAHLAPENLRKAVTSLENRSHSGHTDFQAPEIPIFRES